ncbi:family 10 glycosylhydrolase [Deinococcus radiomollis]|uniref:family 10 glycosylhydrolase n=1 Tax=Deinococcus radiomollis TaxID=468916 RepID=UPI003891F691
MRFSARLPFIAALSVALGLGQPASAQPTPMQPGVPHRTAVWIRPPDSPQELERTLVAARQAGFTDVLLEGFYHGRAIWKSEVAPMKLGYDALALASAVAGREGLGLNIWFETLYWRPDSSFGIPVTPLWKDSYATLSSRGQTSLEVSKLGFVDPADPQVQELLGRLTGELGRLYPQVGLHLDYLRYPREADFGYHPAAVSAFRAQTGLELRVPESREPGGALDDPGSRREPGGTVPEWRTFRQAQITGLAARLISSYRAAGGRGMVSAAVFGRNDPLQDWRHWPGLEVAMPMLYYPLPLLYRLVPFQFTPGEAVWPGIQLRAGGSPLAEQLALLHGLGYPNVAVFGWTPDLP